MTKSATHHYGKIIHGMLTYYNKALLDLEIKELDGYEFDIVLKEKKKRVSLDTHGYYRGGVLREALKYEKFDGYSEDDIHDLFADMFLRQDKMLIQRYANGKTRIRSIIKVRSTADLNQSEMNIFIKDVVEWLEAEGIVIHPPEAYYLSKYKTSEE